ncbi:MAG: DUF2827 domain-containing protein [Ramlibacter sp.]
MAHAGLRLGITIGLRTPDESLWVNGIKQNAIYLLDALLHVPGVASVCLVNVTDVALGNTLAWDRTRWPTVTFDEARDHLDVLIELGGEVGAERTTYLKQRGTRLVSYCCGFEYVVAAQGMLFGRQLWGHGLNINQRYDALWVIPQIAPTSLHYFQTLRRRPAQVVPFVWEPVFLQERSRALPHQGEYRPRPGSRRLSVMEPNHDIVKFCLYPALIAEEAYRRTPAAIERLCITNTAHLANVNPEFTSMMNQLDLVRQHKAVFLGRHETPAFLAEMTDVMVSHQWGNPLNYFYFDVCWQGYPLVHNAHLCSELGYYYPDNDVSAGCTQLLRAIATHDDQWEDYRERQRAAIARYLPGDPQLTSQYAALLAQLMAQPLI